MENGPSAKHMVKVNIFTVLVIFITVNGNIIKLVGSVFIINKMVFMKDNGRMIYNMEKEKKIG